MQILITKLNRPKADRRWVPRPRLISALDNALSRRVTLISAPAGYGKTTLIAQWLDRSDTPSAWLCLDRHDSDPDRFLSYLIAAVRRVVPEFGTALEALCSAAVQPPADYRADALAGELTTLKHPLAIILEDFHRLVFEPVSALLSRFKCNEVTVCPDHISGAGMLRIQIKGDNHVTVCARVHWQNTPGCAAQRLCVITQ